MRGLILVLMFLAGCSQGAEAPEPTGRSEAAPASQRTDASKATLAGLYERAGANAVPDRICMTGTGEAARFGLVTWGGNDHSCTARGQFTGSALALEGGPACTVRATATAAGLTIGAGEGAGCSYYCGARAALTAGDFVKVGSSAADVAKVTDVAGERVCG